MEKLGSDIKSTNNIHILLTLRMIAAKQNQDEAAESVESQIIKGEYWMRRNPFVGKAVLGDEQTNYFTEDKFIGLDHQDKQWFEMAIPKEKGRQNMYGMFDALVTGDFRTYQKLPGYKISKGRAVGSDTIADEKATIYQFICTPSEDKEKEDNLSIHLKCWTRNSDHKIVRMIYSYPDRLDITYDLIEYDVTIPPDTFTVKIPEGYTRMQTPEERIKMNIPTDIITLKEAYDKARKDLSDYRMIVTDEEGFVKYQIARQGKKWRRDSFEWPILKKKEIRPDFSLGFDNLWAQVTEISGEVRESTYMTYNNKAAVGFWPKENYNDLPQSKYTTFPNYSSITNNIDTLEQVAWPEIENLNSPDTKVTVLPPSEKYPGCVGARVEYIAGARRNDPTAVLFVYWIDPSKDYMCIRYEHHQRKTALWKNDLAWEPNEPIVPFDMNQRYNNNYIIGRHHSRIVGITATAQSPQGYWYPKKRLIRSNLLNYKGERVERPERIEEFYIDFDGSIDSSWFDWPEALLLLSE